MAETPITALRGKYNGYDLYVLASGASAGYIAPSFFDNKITIGVNETWLRFPNVDFTVRKENKRAVPALESGIPLIISKYDCGVVGGYPNRFDGANYFTYEHFNNTPPDYAPNLDAIGTDKIVVSYSTITSALHVAAYMGASNILLVGHDCGLIDGKARMDGLPGALGGETFYRQFLTEIEPHTLQVRERLERVYGCNIYSINPFLNFGLEGHKYER